MPFRGLSIAVYILILITAWFFRGRLYALSADHLPILMGVSAGFFLFAVLLPVLDVVRRLEYKRSWRQRLEEREGFPRTGRMDIALLSLLSSINHFLEPWFRRGMGAVLLGWWRDAGFGNQPLLLIISLVGSSSSGFLLGLLLSGRSLLSGFIASLFLLGVLTLIYSRARMHRRLFQDQFPGVLDRLADSLQAGFSLTQAFAFVVPNLSQPSSWEMRRISNQIEMGFSVDQALQGLYKRYPNEDVRLLVEGLMLQRQVGGNMSAMMRDMADVVRKRVELENEVRTMTAQGRLSAVVIALLVPVSVALLSMFPGYIDVLFNSTVGNMVLIIAGVLEMIGAVIVARLIRIEV